MIVNGDLTFCIFFNGLRIHKTRILGHLMKVFHSADIHLREPGDERWQALLLILQTAVDQKADVVVFAGDFFDDAKAAERLRPLIREHLSDLPFPVIILPGNHDADAFPDGAFWGGNVRVISDTAAPVRVDGATFWGLPFQDSGEAEVISSLTRLARQADPSATNYLLFHGELTDMGFGWQEYGAESQKRYMPAPLEAFDAGPWKAVLAGHLHRNFLAMPLGAERYMIYPGSPVAITRNDLGRRSICVLEDDAPPRALELDTKFYQKCRIRLDPLQSFEPAKEIKAEAAKVPRHGVLLVEISGFFNGLAAGLTEEEFYKKLKSLENDRIELNTIECRDIRRIADDPLFRRIVAELKQSSQPKDRSRQILGRILQAMME